MPKGGNVEPDWLTRVFVWTLGTDQAREASCSAAGDGITEAEWTTLIDTLDYASPCSD